MKKPSILFLLSAALLASCGNGGASNSSKKEPSEDSSASIVTPVEVTDGIGRKVSVVPSDIKKIICVGAGALRYYSYLESGKGRLVGIEDIDNPSKRGASAPFSGVARPYFDANANEWGDLPTCGEGGPMHQKPELEKIVTCAPDLIISDYETNEQAEQMEKKSGAKVFTVKYGKKGVFDDTFATTLTSLGKLLGKEDRSQTILNCVNEAKEDIAKHVENVTSKPKVYLGGVGNWGQKDYLSTNPTDPSFAVAGVINVLADQGLAVAGVQSIEKEKFAAISGNIDIMILDAAGMAKTIGLFKEDKTIFDGVKAVENGEVYLQLPYNAYYQNIEIHLINTYFVASSVYPSAFVGFDIAAKADEILEVFTGKKIYAELAAMKGQYGGYQKIADLRAFLTEKVQ